MAATVTSVEFDELLKGLEVVASREPEYLIHWNNKDINDFFGIDWETSQLNAIIHDLGLMEAGTKGAESVAWSLAGGSLVRHFLKTDIFKGDIDLFPSTQRGLLYLHNKFKDRKGFEKNKFAYNFPYKLGMRETKVQIVFHNPQKLENRFAGFDFEHCKVAFNWINFTSSKKSLLSIATKRTQLGHVQNPAYSLTRALKYKKMGFEMDDIIEKLAYMAIKTTLSEEDAKMYAAGDYA